MDCGYTLEPPQRDGSNAYPQSMFGFKIKKIEFHYIPHFCYIKVGFKWVYITRKCYPDGYVKNIEILF